MVVLSIPRRFRFFERAGPEKAKSPAGKCPPPDSGPFNEDEL
jgi:hypothetical protein